MYDLKAKKMKVDVPLGLVMLGLLFILITYIFKFSMGKATAVP